MYIFKENLKWEEKNMTIVQTAIMLLMTEKQILTLAN
jgi:hypothetical protein